MTDIKSMYPEELDKWVSESGEPAYRSGQIFKWLHHNMVQTPDDMSNIPGRLKDKIGEITSIRIRDVQVSSDGTRKYLFELSDGNLIESVLMRYKYGNTVCVSSQAGCRMGCRFCASTIGGLTRNLTAAEILDQVYKITLDIKDRISHIVVMGCGEPLDNYDNLIRFLTIISHPEGYGLSRRNITVSTCGLADRIRELADLKFQITLAISLHAPTDELRKTIMPIAEKYTIAEVIDACEYYFRQTGRRITLEYALAKGVNDSAECSDKLADIAYGLGAHVNLIPVNPVRERGYDPTPHTRLSSFKNELEKKGINVTIRRELGQDIDGACGQLRKRYLEDKR